MEIPDHIINFDIKEFCETLNYYPVYPLTSGVDFLLIPRYHIPNLLDNLYTDMDNKHIKFNNDDTVVVGKNKFKYFCFAKDKIKIVVPGTDIHYTGTVYEDKIEWSNNTIWEAKIALL